MTSVFERDIFAIGVDYDHKGIVRLHSRPIDVSRLEVKRVRYTTFEALGSAIVRAVEMRETNFIRVSLPSQAINDPNHTIFLFQPPDEYILPADSPIASGSDKQSSYSFLIPVPNEEERGNLPVLTVQGTESNLLLSRLDEITSRHIAIAYYDLPDDHRINIKTRDYTRVPPKRSGESVFQILINTPKAIIFRLDKYPPFAAFLCDPGIEQGDLNYMDAIINPQAIPQEFFRNR